MKKVIVIYDDSLKPNKEIRSITGDKSYGDTIFKRVTLKNRMREEIEKNKNVVSMYSISDERENEKLKEELTKMQEGRADRKSTRLNSSHTTVSRMPSSA